MLAEDAQRRSSPAHKTALRKLNGHRRPPRYYSLDEAAIYCKRSVRTLYRDMNAGLLVFYLIRHRRRFLKSDLNAYNRITTMPDFHELAGIPHIPGR